MEGSSAVVADMDRKALDQAEKTQELLEHLFWPSSLTFEEVTSSKRQLGRYPTHLVQYAWCAMLPLFGFLFSPGSIRLGV